MNGRRAVTVAEWNNRPDELIDEYAYWYNPEAAADGFDPWALIEGIDPHIRDGQYDVLFVKGTYRTVSGDQTIYVRAHHYDVLRRAAACEC